MALDKFQSTLPARGATRPPIALCRPCVISIHAPRTGSDTRLACRSRHELSISIHAPRTGSDSAGGVMLLSDVAFQSTLPARGATASCWMPVTPSTNFNPRSPHGERRRYSAERLDCQLISIHAPRTGSDCPRSAAPAARPISIHAPRTGSDTKFWYAAPLLSAFQSTLPARGATHPSGKPMSWTC